MQTLRLDLDVSGAERPSLRYAAEEVLRPLGLSLGGDPESPRLGTEVEEVDMLREVFGWLSGAREHAILRRDRWGRIPFAAMPDDHRADPLATPVDDLRRNLAKRLRGRGVPVRETRWEGSPWAICLTHDLDALRTRRLRALLGEAVRGRPGRGIRRAVGPDDRIRSARTLAELAERHDTRATFFVKAGTSGPEDVAARPERHASWFRSLRESGHEIGLHPSIQAATDPARLGAEADRLAVVLGERPALVRSHFLRWEHTTTPAIYADAGFTADSTLGWAETAGFRRGTAHPFRLWDARAGSPSGMWEVPLAVMDTTLFVHQGMTESEAAEMLTAVFAAARRVGGVAVVLWHNSMDGDPAWGTRLRVLDDAVARAKADGAALVTVGRALAAARGAS